MVKLIIKRITIRKIGVISLEIIIALIILELLLRLSGFLLLEWQRYGNRDTERNAYRILALGESTTANLRNGQSSWPEELEIILNSKSKIKFKVFNEGVPATTTYDILQNLEKNLDKYKPDMVIVMMGVNDPKFYIKPIDKVGVAILYLKNLRIYKLVKAIPEILEENISKWKYKSEEQMLKKSVENNPNEIEVLFNLSKFYLKHGDYLKMVDIEKELIELDPTNYWEYVNLGLTLQDLKKYREAEQMFKKAIELNEDPNDEATLYISLGNLYSEWNKPYEAINAYRVYSKYFENYYEIVKKYDEHTFIQVARLFKNLNYTNTSYHLFRVIVKQNPHKTEEVLLIGELYEKLNKTDEALNIFRAIIKNNSNNYAAYSELAWHYLKNNRSEEAEKILSSIKEKNVSILVYGDLGTRYEKEDNFKKANEMFEKAFSFDRRYYRPTPK